MNPARKIKQWILNLLSPVLLKKLLNIKAHLFFYKTAGFLPSESELKTQRDTVFHYTPLISIITPVFNTQKEFLVNMLESVKDQTYSNYELCLYDTSDQTHDYTEKICLEYQKQDPRILYIRGDQNLGIVGNSNKAVEYAHGEYLALLDHDDILMPNALFDNVSLLNKNQADFIYSDEGYFLTNPNHIYKLRKKPDFNIETLRKSNFICHFVLIRRNLFKKAGGFRNGYDGSQDHELFLRLSEYTDRIIHLPKVLYLWRINPFSFSQTKMGTCRESGLKAVRDHLARLGLQAKVTAEGELPIFSISYGGKEK